MVPKKWCIPYVQHINMISWGCLILMGAGIPEIIILRIDDKTIINKELRDPVTIDKPNNNLLRY